VPSMKGETRMNVAFQDIVSLLQALAWPAVVVVVVLSFRKELPKLVQALGGRISGLSAVGISFEFAAAEPAPDTLHLLDQIKEPSSTGPPPPSGVKSLLELANSSPRADYLIIDLREGRSWLTSRLYLFSVVLPSVLGVRCFVFVGTNERVPRSFLGLSSPESVARALETRYTWLRKAMVQAQLQALITGTPPSRYISWSPHGDAEAAMKRLVQPVNQGNWDVPHAEALDEIIRGLVSPIDLLQPGQVERFVNQFLHSPELRRPHTGATLPDWVHLDTVDEHAEWIKDERHLLDLLGDALRHDQVVDNSTNEQDVIEKAVLRKRSSFVAVTDSQGRVDRLIDRAALLEKIATGNRR
jgi:hypothetical protein